MNDPAISRPRGQRRHQNHHGHKDEQPTRRYNRCMDISHISLIHGRPSPPPRWDSTPHAPTPTLQKALDPTKNERHKHKRMTRVERCHPYGEGHEQAGRRSPPPRWDPTPHTTTPTLQQAHDPTKNAKFKHKHLARPARYHFLGEGHEQARSARLEQGIGQVQPRLTSKDRKKIPSEHKSPRPDNTQATATVQYTHSTLLKSSNRTMAAARRTRTTTLCMAWHAQQETSNCATIPTDTGRRGHPVSTTSFAAGGVAI